MSIIDPFAKIRRVSYLAVKIQVAFFQTEQDEGTNISFQRDVDVCLY